MEENNSVERNNFKWYVLLTMGKMEVKVKDYILAAQQNQHPTLSECVSQVLVPMEKIVTVKNGKRSMREVVKISRYVFVEANMTRECKGALRNVPGVFGFLEDSKGFPKPIPQQEINRLIGTDDAGVVASESLETFLVGEKVKVVEGSFAGFNAEVKEVLAEKKKLKVIITIFERETSLELSYHQVAKE